MTPGNEGQRGAEPAPRRANIFDVARLAGVSHQTVSRVLNDLPNVRPATRARVESAIAAVIAYSSENRNAEGIIGQLTVRENIALAIQAERGVFRRMGLRRQRELAVSWIEALGIRPTTQESLAGTLSGGNQQKVLLARLLALAPRVLLLDEPTRGIDVGAKVEVQNLVNELADNGMSVIFISSELEEVLRVSSRISVLRDGYVVATLPAEELRSHTLLAMVTQPDDNE